MPETFSGWTSTLAQQHKLLLCLPSHLPCGSGWARWGALLSSPEPTQGKCWCSEGHSQRVYMSWLSSLCLCAFPTPISWVQGCGFLFSLCLASLNSTEASIKHPHHDTSQGSPRLPSFLVSRRRGIRELKYLTCLSNKIIHGRWMAEQHFARLPWVIHSMVSPGTGVFLQL